jgi:large repetitive protein
MVSTPPVAANAPAEMKVAATAAPAVFGTREADPQAVGKPAPYSAPAKVEDVAATKEQAEFLKKGRMLQERATPPDEKGNFTKRRVVEVEGFKYRHLRVEESWTRDAASGLEKMVNQLVMVADHFLVTVRPQVQEADFVKALDELGAKVRRRLPGSQVYVVETGNPDLDIYDTKLAEFRLKAPAMEVVEPDYVVFALVTPNDPSFSSLWGLHNTGQTGGTGDADIDAPEAWEVARGGSSVVVGVIDTGIDYTHPDLAANMWVNVGEIPQNGIDDDGNGYVDDTRGWDFVSNDSDPADDHYHGTHCAGTIGAVGDNGTGVVGVCHTVRLMALKFLSGSGSGTTSDAIEAVLYATANRATMTSNSWGGGGYSQTLKNAIDAAGNAGLLFVAAAGNSSLNTDVTPSYPGSYDSANIISVAASDHKDVLASFSNYGAATVDLAAPGVSIYSTSPGNGYRSLSGTSMACPHVAGACALIKAARPAMNWSDIKAAVLNNVDGVAGMTGKVLKNGRLNVARSLIIATEPYLTLNTLTSSDNGQQGSVGNGNGIINPGEDIALGIVLKNVGAQPAVNASTTMTVISAGDKVTVMQGSQSWGNIPVNETVSTGATPFILRVAADTATPHPFKVRLVTTGDGGLSWTAEAQMTVLTDSTIMGRVTAITGGAGINGAMVNYTGTSSGSVLTGADGSYTLNLTNGTYQVRATVAGYNSAAPISVSVPPSAVNVDFALGRSRLQVSPTSLTSTQIEDSVAMQTLTVTNDGDQPLSFTVNSNVRIATLAQDVATRIHPSAVNGPLDASPESSRTGTAARLLPMAGTTQLPFVDSFESGTLNGWVHGSGSGTRQTTSFTAASGSKSFYHSYQGSTDHFQGINRDFVAGAKPKNISFWIRSGSTTTHDGYFVLTDGTYGDELIWFFANGTGKFYVNGTTYGGDESFSYQANVWYKVEFREMDWVAKNFDYYVNGSLVKANIPFRNSAYVDEVSQLWLYNFSTGSEAWWDDIRIMDAGLDWLTVAPDGATLAPGQSATLTATFNATDKIANTYLGQIDISSNDPANPVLTVPVTMVVQTAPNTPPVADPQTVLLDEDTQSVITLTGSDAEGHALTAQIHTLPSLGSLYQTSDGTSLGERITSVPATVSHAAKKVIFVPAPNAHGTPYGTFQFVMKDKRSQSTASTVTLNVTSVNDLPVAFNDSASGLPGQVISPINVLLNDLEPDGQALTISAFTQGQKGTVAANGDGSLRFTPNANFTIGEDSFTYTISDGAGGTSTATVNVAVGTLAGGPWPMMGRDAAHTGFYPGTLNGQTLSLAWSLQVAPQALNQVSIAEGKVFATPDIYFNETQLSAVDLATGTLAWKKVWPVAARSLNGPAYHNGTVYVQRGNHSSDSQLWALNTADGSTRWSTPFSAQWETYLPPTVTEDAVYVNGGSYGGIYGYNRVTGAQLFFTSLEQYDGWTPSYSSGNPYSYVAGKLRQHHATTGAVNWQVAVGTSGSGRVAAIASNAAFVVNTAVSPSELVCADLTTQTVRWRVATGFSGTPSVGGGRVYCFDTTGAVRAFDIISGALLQTYTTGIGTSGLYQPIITNDALIASSSTSTAIHTLSTGVKTQTVAAGGIPSLSNGYLLLAGTDGVLRCYAVLAGNAAPVAASLTSTCVEDQTVTITLNGTDADADSLLALVTSIPAKGTLFQTTDGVQIGAPITLSPVIVQNPQRKVIYRPAADGFGAPYTTFKFKLNDGLISSAEATATINVTNVNDAPQAVDDTVYLRAGSILAAYSPTANDKDADGEVLTIIAFTEPSKGVLTQNGNGSLRYVPQASFTEGVDSFQYTLSDGSGLSSSATVQIFVSASYGAEWSQFGNGPDHTGRYPGALGTQAWVQRWEYAFPTAINPLAVGAGKVYVTPTGNWNSYMHAVALDALTGGEAWRTQFQPGHSMNPPSYHKGVVFTQRGNHGSDTQLWALNAGDGSVKWSTPHGAQWERYFSPAVSDLGVYVNGGYYGGIYGFNQTTGAQKFFLPLEQEDRWTPAIHDGKVYSFVNGMFRNHHPETGVVQWSLNLAWNYDLMARTICCDAGKAYVTNDTPSGAELICIDLQTQAVAWRVQAAFTGTPAISNGIVFACSGGMVKAYNSSTGAWIADFTAASETYLNGAPVVSSDLLFVASSTKTYIFNLATRAVLQTLNFGSQIAVADDLLYLSCSDNKVRVFGRAVPSNQVPVALAAQVGIQEEAEVSLTLEGTDGDGESLAFVVRSLPAQGTLYQTADGITKGALIGIVPAQVQNSAGRVIYRAPLNAVGNGVGSFTFTAHDRVSSSAAATVTINVAPVNDPPVAISDIIALRPGESLQNFRPQANDRDPDGDTLTVVAFTQGTNGQVSQSADGSLLYVPVVGFTSGTDSFAYTIRDAAGVEASATVHIAVSSTLGRSWPTFGANPEHTGFLPLRLGTATFTQRWQSNLTRAAHQLAVADGKVVASLKVYQTDSSIVALDASSGGELWRTNFTGAAYMNPPTWHDGSVFYQYSASSSSKLYRLNGTTGAITWQAPFGAQWEEYFAPAVDSAGVFVNGGTYGGMYGFNPASGSQLFFNSTLGQYDQWTPTLHNGGLYSFVNGKFRSHNKATGATLWTLDFGWNWAGYDMNRTTAAVNGRVFLINDSVTIPAGDQELICVNLSTQLAEWKMKGRFKGTPAVAHEIVFAISGVSANAVQSFDSATGIHLGTYSLPGTDAGLLVQPIVTNDTLIAASATKTYIFNLASRTLRQTIPFGGNISLAGESIYIASSDGIIRAFGVPDALNTAPAALAQTGSTSEDTDIPLTLQGTDADNDTLNFVISSLPSLGTLHQTTNGVTAGVAITNVPALVTHAGAKVFYRPPLDRNGSPLTTFQFAASDGKATSATATVTVHVLPVNDAPVARADARMVTPGQILSPVRELLNDLDVDGDALSITAFTQPTLGSVVQNTDGTLRYHAPSNVTEGTTSFTYTIADASDVTATATVAVTIAPAITGSWPTFGNGPSHTGYSSSALGRTGWTQRWSYTATDSNNSLRPIASSAGRIFASFRDTTNSRLVAVDAGNGAQLWSRAFASGYSMNPPSFHNGRVYVQRGNHSSDTQLIAVSAATGDTVWTAPHGAQWENYMAPAVSDLGVFINGGNYGGLYGFGLTTGNQLFFQTKAQTDNWTPSILDSELYAFVNGDLVRHNPATGAVLWTKSLGWGGSGYTVGRTTALEARRAYGINDSPSAAYNDEDLVGINLDTQATVWSVNGEFTGTPAVSSGAVFAISSNTVQARSAADGILVATYATPAGTYLSGQPIVTDDLVITASDSNTFIFGRYDRALLATLNRGGHPAVVDDALIISSPATGTITAWAAQPAITFSPAGGTFAQPFNVIIGAPDPATKIHYTVDGSAPDFNSPWLTAGSPVRMGWTGTIRAISVKGSEVSRIHSASYVITDADNDGVPDWWEQQHFGSLTTTNGAADSDQDGISDIAEFAAGTDPFSSGDRLVTEMAQSTQGDNIVIRWPSKIARLYVVELSEDLSTWNAATSPLTGTGSQMEHNIPIGANGKKFIRVRVLHGLSPP